MDPTRPYDPTNPAQVAFVKQVAIRMDEISGEAETPRVFADKVYGFACEAADVALSTVPVALIERLATRAAGLAAIHVDGSDGMPGDVRGASLPLPATAVRLVRARLASWSFPALETTPAIAAPEWRLMRSPHTRLPAALPVVYTLPAATGDVLELYPAIHADLAAETSEVLVVVRQRPEALAVASPLLAAVVAWEAASRTFAAERLSDQAERASAYAVALLNDANRTAAR